jgi:hypothetical protein
VTELQLKKAFFTLESLSSGQRHCLSRLKSLKLVEVAFLGPMRKYFYCPRLEYLQYSLTWDLSIPGTNINIEGFKSPYKLPIQDTFDEAFFQETSALVHVSLQGTIINGAIGPTLASCPNLRTLEIHDCGIEYFIGSVLENLQDAKYLPSLGVLTINSSWPVKLDISYDEFWVQCSSKRPEFYISGNGQEELPEIGSDAYELESYVESD